MGDRWLAICRRNATIIFSDVVGDFDRKMLKVGSDSDCTVQQAFEALALLVALRMWLPAYKEQRVIVTTRSDNLSALFMLSKMQPKSASLSVVAREVALDIASSAYAPDFTEHVPGISNIIADELSRKHQPGVSFKLPKFLFHAKEHVPSPRLEAWWTCYKHRQ